MSERTKSLLERTPDDEWEEYFCEFGDKGSPSPRVVDWELTGKCQYRCEWCWGPDHAIGGAQSMTTREVTRAMTLFAVTNNNPRFVLTGGEPMLRADIDEILDNSCGQAAETVLSTTGDVLMADTDRSERVWNILDRWSNCSTIAVPLHASDVGLNSLLMPRTNGGVRDRLDIVSSVLSKAQSLGVFATLRTTITGKQTAKDVLAIPDLLAERGVDLTRLRWKVYQYDSYVGPRTAAATVTKYALHGQNFDAIGAKIRKEYSGVIENVSLHPVKKSSNNYVIVGPSGEVRLVESDSEGLPKEAVISDVDGKPLRFADSPYEVMGEITTRMPLHLWDPELVDDEDLAALTQIRR